MSDSHYANVVLALPMLGANGSKSIADLSPVGNVIMAAGSAAISTAQSKFGGSSLYCDGTGDYVSTSSMTFGTGDFTIEAWLYTSDTTAAVISQSASNSLTIGWNIDNGSQGIGIWKTGVGVLYVSGSQPPTNQWFHLAVTSSGGTIRIFVDGTKIGTNYTNAHSFVAGNLRIGADGISSSFDYAGYVADLRITKNVPRYTANFTPPVASFAGVISGNVKDSIGANCARNILAVPRVGGVTRSATSDGITGHYTLGPVYDTPHLVCALDDDAGTDLNDLILGRVSPVLYT